MRWAAAGLYGGRMKAGRIALLVAGSVLTLVSLGLLAGGGALLWAHETQRDSEGFYSTDTIRFASPTNAIVSESLELEDVPDWFFDEGRLGSIRIRATSLDAARPVFVGIGPRAEVDAYLATVAHAIVADVDLSGTDDVSYRLVPGSETSPPPGEQAFWVTPQAIAQFLVQWAVRSPADTIFEPSCGEAAFLAEAVSRLRALGATSIRADQLQGMDIDRPSVDAARALLAECGAQVRLSTGDFFDARPASGFYAVIGNPPYVRYQAFTGAARTKGLEAALAQGVRLTGLASSWAAFVVHATSFLAPMAASRWCCLPNCSQ